MLPADFDFPTGFPTLNTGAAGNLNKKIIAAGQFDFVVPQIPQVNKRFHDSGYDVPAARSLSRFKVVLKEYQFFRPNGEGRFISDLQIKGTGDNELHSPFGSYQETVLFMLRYNSCDEI
ncbi:hypothetical protein ES708_26390 [subsurface metagenome]